MMKLPIMVFHWRSDARLHTRHVWARVPCGCHDRRLTDARLPQWLDVRYPYIELVAGVRAPARRRKEASLRAADCSDPSSRTASSLGAPLSFSRAPRSPYSQRRERVVVVCPALFMIPTRAIAFVPLRLKKEGPLPPCLRPPPPRSPAPLAYLHRNLQLNLLSLRSYLRIPKKYKAHRSNKSGRSTSARISGPTAPHAPRLLGIAHGRISKSADGLGLTHTMPTRRAHASHLTEVYTRDQSLQRGLSAHSTHVATRAPPHH
jgi:hypothetical protein